MIINTQHSDMLISPARTVVGRVELYEGSTLTHTFTHTDALSSFTINRAGAKKFFGFGIAQELELKLVDRERSIEIKENNILKVSFGVNGDFVYPTPPFYVSEVQRDENTNEITVKAYDILFAAAAHHASELPEHTHTEEEPLIINTVLNDMAQILGISNIEKPEEQDAFMSVHYPEGFNFDGAETFRELFDNIAEVSQTIYYINPDGTLVFKRLDKDGEPVVTIRKADYFTLDSKQNRILSDICSATELGDNVITTSGIGGEIQYVRDNPFWELREDITNLLNAAIDVTNGAGGLSINQFNCKWRGNYLIEPGDKISLVTKDDSLITSYLLDDKYIYNGGLSSNTSWEYADNKDESADNPVTLGDALKKTYAKVDKANQQIEIVAGEAAAIKLSNEAIQATVSQMDEDINGVLSDVSALVTADEVSIAINRAMEQGIERVTTTTGFTFNEEGLHVSRTGSEMTTSITEDGMVVSREEEAVLVADNQGVKAEDLHATTFLIIGNNSRLEDYDGNRTGCFYIGKI